MSTERSRLEAFAKKHLNMTPETLSKLTMFDITTHLHKAKIQYPPPPETGPLPSSSGAGGPAPLIGGAAPLIGGAAPFIGSAAHPPPKNEEDASHKQIVAHVSAVECRPAQNGAAGAGGGMMVVAGAGGSPANGPMVGSASRDKALDTMEHIHMRITNSRAKLHDQIEVRNRLAMDSDFDNDDIARFDECIQRGRVSLQEDFQALCARMNAYKEFMKRRREKDQQVFSTGLGDEILHRDWARKEEENRQRMSGLEKAISGCNLLQSVPY